MMLFMFIFIFKSHDLIIVMCYQLIPLGVLIRSPLSFEDRIYTLALAPPSGMYVCMYHMIVCQIHVMSYHVS
jgi:hypothetical protein